MADQPPLPDEKRRGKQVIGVSPIELRWGIRFFCERKGKNNLFLFWILLQ